MQMIVDFTAPSCSHDSYSHTIRNRNVQNSCWPGPAARSNTKVLNTA